MCWTAIKASRHPEPGPQHVSDVYCTADLAWGPQANGPQNSLESSKLQIVFLQRETKALKEADSMIPASDTDITIRADSKNQLSFHPVKRPTKKMDPLLQYSPSTGEKQGFSAVADS